MVPAATPIPTDGPVLLGLGMSLEDEPAIAFAFEEAALRRVPLLAVHVWSGIPARALATVSPFAYDLYEAQSVADRTLAETLAGWADKYPDVPVDRSRSTTSTPPGPCWTPAPRPVWWWSGPAGDSRRSSQLLGTVTRSLIAHASRPVAVIRPTPRAQEVRDMDTERSETGRVVVGVDDTLSGLQALRRAVAEVTRAASTRTLLRELRRDIDHLTSGGT